MIVIVKRFRRQNHNDSIIMLVTFLGCWSSPTSLINVDDCSKCTILATQYGCIFPLRYCIGYALASNRFLNFLTK